MKSQFSRRERIFQRIVTWSYVALGLSHVIASWSLRGKPELLWSWFSVAKYLTTVCVGLQVAGLVFVLRWSGIVLATLVLIAGGSFLCFIVFLQMWMLLLSVALSIAGGFCLAWPQIRDFLNRMGRSYREIAKSAKM